jgi:hypothetical protein
MFEFPQAMVFRLGFPLILEIVIIMATETKKIQRYETVAQIMAFNDQMCGE